MSKSTSEETGYVTVFEASGEGGPAPTVWQFIVNDVPVRTENRDIAEVMKMAIDLRKKVRVLYDKEGWLSQARLSLL